MRVLRNHGGEWDVRLGKKINNFAWMGMKLFWHTIYCANPKSKPDHQSGSLSYKGLGRRDLLIIWEYDLGTAIEIRPLNQERMCKMASSIFLP